jgi:hypothetical protein
MFALTVMLAGVVAQQPIVATDAGGIDDAIGLHAGSTAIAAGAAIAGLDVGTVRDRECHRIERRRARLA